MHGLDTYDFGARGYYAAVGRFMTLDPLAELTPYICPYAYCKGNPVNMIDPTGMYTIYDFDGNPHEIGDKDVRVGHLNADDNENKVEKPDLIDKF